MKERSVFRKEILCALLILMFGVVSCKSQEITSNPLKTERYKTGTFVALQDKIKKRFDVFNS